MTFADITMVPVPNDRKDEFLAFSARMAVVYREHGARRIVDYWQAGESADPADFHADGADYEEGDLRGLAAVVGSGDAESVAITIMEWSSRAARDRGMAAAAADPRVTGTLSEEPLFDGRRVVGETFEVVMREPAEDEAVDQVPVRGRGERRTSLASDED